MSKSSPSYYLKLLLLSFAISLPLILPYFKTGYFPTHDGEWAVVRLSDMYREIKNLEIPARFSGYLNFQYGYPLFNFEYPMPYYIGSIFVFLKLGFVNTIKFLFASSVILSFFSMYLLSKSVWKSEWSGFISGVFYLYVPYRVVDLFVRGSLGESMSFVLFPLILLGIKRLHESKNLLNVFIVGFLYALLICMHNIMAVLFGLIVLAILLVSLFKRNFSFVAKLISSLIFSLSLSAFFWLPALFEKNLILLSKIPIADRSLYFATLNQLIFPKWGYAPPTDPNGFSYQIGIPQIVVFVLAIALLIINRKSKDAKLGLFLAGVTIILSFLMLSPSAFIWLHTPLLSEINYPWTVLSVIMFLIGLLSGYIVRFGRSFLILGLLLSVFSVVFVIGHAKPQTTVNRGDEFYLTNQGTTTSSNELMPLWVKKQPLQQPLSKVEAKGGQITNLVSNSKKISFSVDLPKTENVIINTIYYPGWNLFIDGQKATINYSNPSGVMDINVRSGKHSIMGKFSETPLRVFSDLLSILSLIVMVVYAIFYFPTIKTKIR